MKLIHIFNINKANRSTFRPTFSARRTTWKSKTQEFIVMGKAPIAGFYGFDNFGEVKAYDGNEEDWEFVRLVCFDEI